MVLAECFTAEPRPGGPDARSGAAGSGPTTASPLVYRGEVQGPEGPIAVTVVPATDGFRWPAGPVAGAAPPVLARLAFARVVDGVARLDSPLAAARIEARAAAAEALLGAVGAGRLDNQLGELLQACGLTEPAEPGETAAWEFHDLLFHRRTRAGTDAPYGAVGGRAPDAPAVPPLHPRSQDPEVGGVELPVPDLDAARRTDPPLTAVLESRRSAREFRRRPLAVDRLGELLYRTSRVLQAHEDTARRPYPSAGGAWELEVWPLALRLEGIEPGLLRYDPVGHRLHSVPSAPGPLERLALRAATAAGVDRLPPVVLLASARFGRLNRRYRSVGYALVLKDVGVWMQTVYLVATAMGLGACALGGGSGAAFAEATGLDPLREASVGEMLLGEPTSTGWRGATGSS